MQINYTNEWDESADQEAAPAALGDPMFCHSIFHNLIKNACEAALEDGTVDVTLKNHTPLLIHIKNRGAVPAAVRANFFDKFVTEGKQRGSGLGTYSAKLLVEAQGGEIAMETSGENNGKMIGVSLPRL